MLSAALQAIQSADAYAVARARALMTAYHERWAAKWAGFNVLKVEHEFCFPLLNPETSAASRSFSEAGKMDVLVATKLGGRKFVVEHKTTSDSVAPESNYWDRLRMDTQCSKYYLAATNEEGQVAGVIYDVIAKPAHRPSQIAILDADGIKIVLDNSGQRMKTKDGKKWRQTADNEQGYALQSRTETPEEFESRLIAALRSEPEAYLAQREIARLDSDILEYMDDAWAVSQEIIYRRSRKLWPRNPDACTAMGTCEMFDLCSGRASVDGIRYRSRNKIHAELVMQGGEKQLLTNSRMKAHRKCARYHQLRYEQGIEKAADESEALHLGTLVHLALEAYFLKMKQIQNENY